MLEQLFGSKTRVKLLKLFLNNPEEIYYLRQLARSIKGQLNSVRREINNLENIGVIALVEKNKLKKHYKANSEFILYPELKALIIKTQLLLEKNFVAKIKKCANIHYLALTGFFVGVENWPTDMIVVGAVNKNKLSALIKKHERELNHSINYTVMKLSEFRYRQDVTDKFLYDLLEGKKVVVIDKINS